MKGKLIGYYRKFGKFTPKDSTEAMEYDNVILQFSTPGETGSNTKKNVTVEGKPLILTEMKFKLSSFQDSFDYPIERLSDLDNFIGNEFEWFYNQYGRPERVCAV